MSRRINTCPHKRLYYYYTDAYAHARAHFYTRVHMHACTHACTHARSAHNACNPHTSTLVAVERAVCLGLELEAN